MTHAPVDPSRGVEDTPPVVDITWFDIAGGCMVPGTRSDCGCAVWEHQRGTGFQALLHNGIGHCALGRDDAEIDGVAVPRWRLAAGLHGCETEDEARAVVEAQAREEAHRATAYAAALPPAPPPRLDLYPGGGETVDGSATLSVVPTTGNVAEPWVETMTEAEIWAAATLNPLHPDGLHFTRPEPVAPPTAEPTALDDRVAAATINGDHALAAALGVLLSTPEPAQLAEDADDAAAQTCAIQTGELQRAEEQAILAGLLAPFFARRDPDSACAELNALMTLTLGERAEVVEAAKTGRLARLGLWITDLAANAPGSRQAWLRLKEGAAGPWSAEENLPELTDAELDALLNAEPPVPAIGGKLFYRQGLHLLAGPGGCGKTWIVLDACAKVIPPLVMRGAHSGPYAVYLDMDQNHQLHPRLQDLGVSRDQLRRRDVAAINITELAAERREGVVATLRSIIDGFATAETPPLVVVVDSLTRVMAELGESSNDPDAITRGLGMFNVLAARTCVIVLDHTGHQEPDRPSGAAAKINACRVVLTLRPFDSDLEAHPNTLNSSALVQTKDRDGGLRMHLAPTDRGYRPELGLIFVDRDKASGHTEIKFIAARVTAAAEERRETDAGRAFAAKAKAVIRRVVDAAAREAVNATAAKAQGVKVKPPLSATSAADVAWELLKDDAGAGRRSDVRAAVTALAKAGELVEFIAPWGPTPGVRLRVKGGLSGDTLDPVDLD
jgi:AAA domain